MVDRSKRMSGFPLFTGSGGLILCTVAVLSTNVSCGSAAAQENAPCTQIRTACTQAGFRQGFAKEGFGLMVDCIRPIMQGVPQRAKATKPLPKIDAELIAACKAANPNRQQ
jgi:hypothetical protein